MAAKKLNDASIATITSLADADYMNTVNASTGEISKILVSDVKASIGGSKVYAASISQSGSSAPTASVALNTTGATLTFARVSTGSYTVTAGSAVFTSGKTLAFLQNVFDTVHLNAKVTSTTVITIRTLDGSFSQADSLLSGNSFKIEIYP